MLACFPEVHDYRAVDADVQLLLLVVVVEVALVARRQHDRVDAEGGHAELVADLAEAEAFAHSVEGPDREAGSLDDFFSHSVG